MGRLGSVISTAFAPPGSLLRQMRACNCPAWLEAFVTAITLSELYHVPRENTPDVADDVRQQSSAKCAPVVIGGPEG
jgi:hypothetical protein